MRYVVFKIPLTRIVTKGGWDDFWHWTDDLADAKMLIARDPKTTLQNSFPGVTPDSVYQIVDLHTGDVVMEAANAG